MNLPNAPKFEFGTAFGTVLQLPIPSPKWRWATKGIGGGDRSAALVPEVFSQARYSLVRLVLRFPESQHAAVTAMVTALADTAGQVRWYPNPAGAPGAFWLCYLEEPTVDGSWELEPDEYPGALRGTITLRLVSATGGAGVAYFPAGLTIP